MKVKESILKLINLEGKTAVVTGGASGIGLASAKKLGECGASVAILDTNKEKGEKAVKNLETVGVKAMYRHCDVSNSEEVKKVISEINKRFNSIDILFNNAGIIVRKNATDISEKEWDLVSAVNMKGIYLLSHYVIPIMRKTGGSIINTGSGWGHKGGPDAISYCATKGAVVNMTKAMAIDLGQYNIRVNCVSPGDTDTELLRGEAKQLGEDMDSFMKDAASRPINRVGTPDDIANAVLFFASDLSSWISGTSLIVDGGGLA
ncbi:MAG: SDR family oxidoreductase [Thermotogota bacterium]|nr:SDR family oxidoreductase [Thermotogota bacterium]